MREGPSLSTEEYVFKGDFWSLPTDIDLLEPAEKTVSKRLKQAGWGEDVDFIQLSFREALINAIAHGNLGVRKKEDSDESLYLLAKQEQVKHPTNKRVKVTVKISKERVYIQIRDEGEGFDPEVVVDPLIPENLLKGSGKGIFMMRQFFDSVKYSKKGKEVTMIKEKKKA